VRCAPDRAVVAGAAAARGSVGVALGREGLGAV